MRQQIKIEINLAAIRENLTNIKREVSGARLMFVVKADAYGHGAVPVARYTESVVDAFGVATLQEALELRQHGITKPILILGFCDAPELAIQENISLSVSDLETAKRLAALADKTMLPARVHLAIDTGMNRFGVKEGVLGVWRILKDSNVMIEGVFSHFLENDETMHALQCARFDAELSRLEAGQLIRHIAASGAVARSACRYDMVRAGIAAYGYGQPFVRPAMRVSSTILLTKDVRRGEFVGYSRAFKAPQDMKIAVVFGGYADGIRRKLTGTNVLVCTQMCPIVGNICMDCFMVDISNTQAVAGDEVVLLDAECLSAGVRAQELETIPYEILTGWHGRCAREYLYE